jgi:hypothetical protein
MMIRARKAGYSGNQTTTEPNASKGPSIPCCEPNLIRPYFAIKSVRFSIFQETLRGVRTTIGYTPVTTKQFSFCPTHINGATQARERGKQYPRHDTFSSQAAAKMRGYLNCQDAVQRRFDSWPLHFRLRWRAPRPVCWESTGRTPLQTARRN